MMLWHNREAEDCARLQAPFVPACVCGAVPCPSVLLPEHTYRTNLHNHTDAGAGADADHAYIAKCMATTI